MQQYLEYFKTILKHFISSFKTQCTVGEFSKIIMD